MSTNHILLLPTPVLALRGVQLATGVAVLGLSAYGLTYLVFDGDALTLFSAIITMIIAVYNIVSSLALKQAYNYWAILGLDIFAIIFWIISMSLLASEVAAYSWQYTDSYYCTYVYGYCVKKRSLETRDSTNVYTYRNAMAAAAGLGGLEVILFAITLIFTSIYLHRHRKAGGHCMPNSGNTAAPGPVPVNAPMPAPYNMAEPKTDVEMQAPTYTHQQQYYQPAPQQHPQPQQPTPVYAVPGLDQQPSA